MFNKGGIKPGQYVFVVQKDGRYNKIAIGRIQSVNGNNLHVIGTYVRPLGLIERIESGRASGRPTEALSNPDPNNCIFILIDRVETGGFNEEVDQTTSRVTWINENRYLVLDGWIKENLPEIFAVALSASTQESRAQARQTLIEKMNSLYERELKEHVYAVARSAKIL
ncbi:MAG TPA: hypothetical protein VGE82_02310 [Nitrososphaera sp.]|jgi:hypothetical protein